MRILTEGLVRALILFILCGTAAISNAQEKFHRNYPSQLQEHAFPIKYVMLRNGDFLGLEQLANFDEDSLALDSIIISNFDPKGNLNWSKTIASSDEKYPNIAGVDLTVAENDSIFISAFIYDDQREGQYILISLNANGRFQNISKSIIQDLPVSVENNKFLTKDFVSSLICGYNNSDTSFVLATRNFTSDVENSAEWYGKNFSGDNLSLQVSDLDNINDTSFVYGGQAVGKTNNWGLIGVGKRSLESSVSYGLLDTFPDSRSTVVRYVHALNDSIFIASGEIHYLDPSRTSWKDGFVLSMHKNGTILWAKKILIGEKTNHTLTGMTVNDLNDVFLSIMTPAKRNGDAALYGAKLSPNGDIKWIKKFPSINADSLTYGSASTAFDQGVVLTTYTYTDDFYQTALLKLDVDGATSCEFPFLDEIFFVHSFVLDTFQIVKKDIRIIDENLELNTYPHDYKIPVLALEVKIFCPNEQINHLLNAGVEGAVSFLWNTGATTDTLRIFDDEEYNVMVRVEKDVCFNLCDTVKMERYTLPNVNLTLSLGDFCSIDSQRLTALYVPGHPEIQNISWSTGQSGQNFINIGSTGQYTVTVTDKCNESASNTISVDRWPMKITEAQIEAIIGTLCVGGSGVLTASGNSQLLGVERYQWNVGSTAQSINITSPVPATYIVTVIDGCGFEAVASYNFVPTGNGIKSVTINKTLSPPCNNTLVLNAVTDLNGTGLVYSWSNMQTTPSITVSAPGKYEVTVTDLCGNTASNSITVPQQDLTPNTLIQSVSISKVFKECNSIAELTVNVNPSGVLRSVLWSNNSTTTTTEVSSEGTYTVTVTDNCGTTATSSITLTVDEFVEDLELKYARVFFPFGVGVQLTAETDTAAFENLIYNRTFGPAISQENNCTDQISEYEFFVFNRWGQKVFESNRIQDEWDGTVNGSEGASDEYIWAVRYKLNGVVEKKLKGQIMLIRR